MASVDILLACRHVADIEPCNWFVGMLLACVVMLLACSHITDI